MGNHCRTCNEAFSSDRDYGLHKRDSAIHDYCWHCNEDFESILLLETHYLHSPRHAFCEYCKHHFHSHQSLENHWEDRHHWCVGHRRVSHCLLRFRHHLQGGMLAIQCVIHSSTVTLMIARQFHQDENGLHEHFKEHPDHPYCEACGFCSETDIYEHYDNQHHPECSECDRVRQYPRV